ncbi:hypothetical protein VNO80_27974 [Phaseolus coccineus]|uniref:Nucleosome assembly protein n=1 Tax=Phaseolus coccineus TaxID=3886 RepID=A0AAN9QFK1_PHACN
MQKQHDKRYDIVNGLLEVEATDEADRATEEKGIPNFWLTAMKTNDTLAELITEADEGPLQYLKDIKWCRVEASKSFKLKFFFCPNPYFRNSVLEKTYHMIDEDEPKLMEATGMEIEWHKGKCLTRKVEGIQKDFDYGLHSDFWDIDEDEEGDGMKPMRIGEKECPTEWK